MTQPAPDSPHAKAKELFDDQVATSPSMRVVIHSYLRDQQIRDVLIPQKHMAFDTMRGRMLTLENIWGEDKAFRFHIHKHALMQVTTKVHVPMRYANMLMAQDAWGPELLSHDLTEIYRRSSFAKQDGEDPTFLLRAVNDELRGFLSNRYALHLSTNPLLTHFLDFCLEQNAVPVEFINADIRVSAKCVLTQMFEPVVDQAICVGMTFHNSDFGAGTFSVSNVVWDPLRCTSMTFGNARWEDQRGDLFNRVHLGPVIREADLNTITSERAERTEKVTRLMRKEITNELSITRIQKILDAVKLASEKTLPWQSLKRSLFQVMRKDEIDAIKDMLHDREPTLPKLGIEVDEDGLPIPTSWWAASAIAMRAKITAINDRDRALDLQNIAGRFIERG